MWQTDLVSYNDQTLVHEFTALGKKFRSWTSGSTPCFQADAVVNVLQNCRKVLQTFHLNISGGECERNNIRVRLGGNSRPISAMSGVHHRYS